jgi:AcrR family transcriptional regulator
MARRKDHTPDELKALILDAAQGIINRDGLSGLTARNLASTIGYTPGTIYNVYRDMDALVMEINLLTLNRLEEACIRNTKGIPAGFNKVKALAYAYVTFAEENFHAWQTIFATTRRETKAHKLPKSYQKKLLDLFKVIEAVLQECFRIDEQEAFKAARLLWACLHGITGLALDGRLGLIGVEKPHRIIDDLLENYFAAHIRGGKKQ